MQVDLTKLTPGQIAAVTAGATLLAAVLAGFFALVVSIVNAWSANRIARRNSKRDYMLKAFQPFFSCVENDMYLLREMAVALAEVVVPAEDWKAFRAVVYKANDRLKWPKLMAIAEVLPGDERVKGAALRLEKCVTLWEGERRNLDDQAERAGKSLLPQRLVTEEHVKIWEELAEDYYDAAMKFREASENFIFR